MILSSVMGAKPPVLIFKQALAPSSKFCTSAVVLLIFVGLTWHYLRSSACTVLQSSRAVVVQLEQRSQPDSLDIKLLQQIDEDLAAYKDHGISKQMVIQVPWSNVPARPSRGLVVVSSMRQCCCDCRLALR